MDVLVILLVINRKGTPNFSPSYKIKRCDINKLKHPTETGFVAGCRHVYFCCKVGKFNMEVYGHSFTFTPCPKWTIGELQP